MSDLTEWLPDRNDSDIPENVQWVLSLAEMAVGWDKYAREHMGEEQDRFFEGVVDYWWEYEDLEEPTFEQLFRTNPFNDKSWQGWPSQERIAYQKGAIVGYELAERFKDGREN